jgi:hypothetical protein
MKPQRAERTATPAAPVPHRRSSFRLNAIGQFDQGAATLVFQRHQALVGKLVGKLAKGADAVIAFGERRVELQQCALQETQLRRHFTIGQHLQRAPHERHGLLDRLRAVAAARLLVALFMTLLARPRSGTTFS